MSFEIKDSGERTTFASGMVRDTATGKTEYDRVLDGPMFDRWAAHLTKAVGKYPDLPDGRPNWMLASGEEEKRRARKSAFRHFRAWLRGDQDEDHAAGVFFNVNLVEYVKEKELTGPTSQEIMKLLAGPNPTRNPEIP